MKKYFVPEIKKSSDLKKSVFFKSINIDSLFLMSFKEIITELLIFFFINTIILYITLFIIPDSTVAILGVLWVGIISWRGGLFAGLISCFMILLSNTLVFNAPPHNALPMQYYMNGKMPGLLMGIFQSLLCASVIGSISTLVHKLRKEINLRIELQKELEQKIAELDAFGHTVAHDLKGPLSVINLAISRLLNDFENSENVKVKRKLGFINEGTKQMINIIESILVLAGIKKGDIDKFTIFPISVCVDDALKRMAYNIEENGIKIDKPVEWPLVKGYAPWITEVWVNYLSNAIKYGGNPSLQIKPEIKLGYDTMDSNYVRFWVKDNGNGIPEDKNNSLFKEFIRLHSSDCEGHGLGLSIIKTIVEKLNGKVGVESTVGEGSLFYFTLPMN